MATVLAFIAEHLILWFVLLLAALGYFFIGHAVIRNRVGQKGRPKTLPFWRACAVLAALSFILFAVAWVKNV